MAGFNVAAGLSQMGETVAKVTGAAALEQQKSGLETERLKLANQLAAERESKGRQEAHGLDMQKLDKTQTFTAGESEKDRANRLEATRISAGASVAAAKMQIDAMAPVRAAQIEAHRVETEGRKLDNDLKTSVSTARKELEAATADGDPVRIKAAQEKVSIYDEVSAFRTAQTKALSVDTDAKAQKLQADKLITDRKEELLKVQNDPARTAELKREIAILESSSKEERAEIALWQQQAKLAETAMTAAMTRLTTLTMDRYGAVAPEDAVLEKALQRILKQHEAEFKAASAQAKARLESLDPSKKKAATTDAPDLTKYLRTVNPPGGGAPAKPKTFPQPPGLIDSTPMPSAP
jgi:hypothetical protein